jgi:hypothetical protein
MAKKQKFFINQFETSELDFWEAIDENLLLAAKKRHGNNADPQTLEFYMDELNSDVQANIGSTGGYVLNGKVFKVIKK